MISRQYGLIFIIVSLFCLILAICQVGTFMFADFPCDYEYPTGRPTKNVDSIISYCISYIGRNVLSGGGIYSEGESHNDKLAISNEYLSYAPIDIKRINETIYVNGIQLNKDETYNWQKIDPTINPWVINTAKFMITNKGIIKQDDTNNTIYVEGEIRESWIMNPLGIILLLVGIYLFRRKRIVAE